jgi:site-specific DNA recombinase
LLINLAKRARTPHRVRQIVEATSRRVAIYIRRSTDEEHQPYSLEAQETKLRAFVESQPGDWTIVAIYSDDASGATLERKELRKMLRAARAGLFDTLLVYRVDRLSRRVRDLGWLLDELSAAEVVFRSATEPFDTSSPAGRLFVQMLGSFAEFEREVIIDRVIAGMERKAAKGLWTSGRRPLGYLIDKEASQLRIVEDEAATVRLIFNRYTRDRHGTQAIATLLNERGLTTRLGKPWSQHTVEWIITNRVYIGEKQFRDIVVKDAHEPIIGVEQFELAQEILCRRSTEIGQRAANPSDYTLTGKIRCPECGRKYVGASAHGRYARYRYYVCWSRVRYGTKAGCGIYRFNADELEDAISAAMIEFYSTQQEVINLAVAEAQMVHSRATSTYRDQLAGVTRELREATVAIDRYLTAFEKGTLDDENDHVQERLAKLKEQTRRLRARKAQLETEIEQPPTAPTPAHLTKISDHIRAVLTHGPPTARKALFEALIEEIAVQADNRLIPVFRIPTVNPADEPETAVEPDPDPDGSAVRALPCLVGDTGFEPVTSSVSTAKTQSLADL